ncbi:MAG: FHA domain-containing protein [Christensenellales bacterium]|nr:FHA domain-containing protein [Christensenellales bacterium]
MSQAWYQVLSLLFGYAGAAVVLLTVLLALKKYMSDRALWRRVQRDLPQAGAVGQFRVLSGGRRLAAGEEIRVPYEGTMGSGHICDVCIPVRKVHMRSAFFWMEGDGLHMAALHRDGFLVDDVPVEPGDEAVLHHGAVLRVGDAKLVLSLYGSRRLRAMEDEPYVTSARRGQARQGRGDGVGAPGRGEARREKRLHEKKMNENKRGERTRNKDVPPEKPGKRSRR